MKLAIVVPGGVDRTGEYRVVPALLAIISRLAARHEVHVFSLVQEPAPGRWQLLGAQVHNVGSGRTRIRALGMIAAEHRRAPFCAIQAFWSGSPGQIAVAAARLLRIPSAVHVAGGELVALADIGYGGRLHWWGRLAGMVTLRQATIVTAASRPMIEALAALQVHGVLLPLGIDPITWSTRAPLERDPTTPARLIHVASLNTVKDQATLLKALALVAQSGLPFVVDMVGEDTLGGAVQALATRLGLADRLRFHGFLIQQRLRAVMESAHLLVMSSRHEAGPIAMLEAAALGVPTVGTAVGHLQEWAPDAAIAVPIGDASALASAVTRVLRDEPLRQKLARRATQNVLGMSADATVASLLDLYAGL